MNWLANFLLAVLRPALGLIALAGLLLFWVLKKKFPTERFLRQIVYIFSMIMIGQAAISTVWNWRIWSQQIITQRLLPPYSPWSYISQYSWRYYWWEPVMAMAVAALVFWSIYFFNKRLGSRLFYQEEKYLAALGILIVGWPNCLIFLLLALGGGMISHLLMIVFRGFSRFAERKEAWRLSLLNFWVPCALLVLLFGDIISRYIGVSQLHI